MKLFLSPHNDDETLFAAFTLMAEEPQVVVVYDGDVQRLRGGTNCTAFERRRETNLALGDLGLPGAKFVGLSDAKNYALDEMLSRLGDVIDVSQQFDVVYAPIYDYDGHQQHNYTCTLASTLDAKVHVRYATYTRGGGKQRTANEVLPTNAGMIRRKHLALARYNSQHDMDPRLGCWPWFIEDMREYVA